MTIKKPTKTVAAEPATAATVAPAVGGATIADRFRLDTPDPNAKKASAGVGTMCAVIAGVLALAAAGILTFIIYQHWQFLANA